MYQVSIKGSKFLFSDWLPLEVELQRLRGQLEFCDWRTSIRVGLKLLVIKLKVARTSFLARGTDHSSVTRERNVRKKREIKEARKGFF